MKTNIRGKITRFLESEDGRVSAKTPLALGVATGGLLLAHAIVGTPQAEAGWCRPDVEDPCPPGRDCLGPFILVDNIVWGTCIPH